MFKKIIFKLPKSDLKILFLIFLIAYLLRIYYLPANAVSFAYDQARDAFVAKEIANGDIKILGPSVSGIPGLYHGVLYYYLITPFYILGGGNPVVVAYALSLLNSLCVFIAYFFTHLLTKKSAPSIVAAILFAFSYEASQYANLLTNPSMAIWFIPLAYIGLLCWLSKKSSFGPILLGLSFGFAVQSEIALLYHFISILLWLFVYRKQLRIKKILMFFLSFLIATSSLILAEIKFGFKGMQGILYLFGKKDGISQERSVVDIFLIYFRQVSEAFSNNIFPQSLLVGSIILIVVVSISLFKSKSRQKNGQIPWQYFLLSAIAPQIVALPFGGTNMRHIMTGASVSIAVFVSIFLHRYFGKHKLFQTIIIFMIILSNLIQIINHNKYGQTIFPLQKDLILSKELMVVDYTYKASKGESFSINTITNPLWINTLWSYLYNWKGYKDYEYLPTWTGNNQVGQPGNNLKYPEKPGLTFLIIEPTYGIPEKYIKESIDEENYRSFLLEEKSFGDIIVQKRKSLNIK